MQCEHCLCKYEPCIYNHKRQKYCTDRKCRIERSKIHSQQWRQDNTDYYKDDSCRTIVYSRQKNERRRLRSAAKAAVSDAKREFVSHLKTSAKGSKNEQVISWKGQKTSRWLVEKKYLNYHYFLSWRSKNEQVISWKEIFKLSLFSFLKVPFFND